MPLSLPEHVAIIMDGNGRWANRRQLPRVAGHRAGVENVRLVVERCGQLGIRVLTVFAFSSENWRRPPAEVRLLMELFSGALEQEVEKLEIEQREAVAKICLLYTSPSPRDGLLSRMPSSA